MNSVFDNLQRIETYSGSLGYLVEPVEGMEKAYSGRSKSGRAVFVIVGLLSPNRPIQTGALSMEIGVDLEAQIEGKMRKLEKSLVIELMQTGEELELYFAEICSALEVEISKLRSEVEILNHLRTLSELFGFKQASREMIKGLWGELKFAALFPDVSDAVQRWQEGSFGRVDFDSQDAGWEVKTVEGSERKHRLSLRQLARPRDLLISLCVEESPAGQSLSDLVESVMPRLSSEMQFKVRVRVLGYSASKEFKNLKLRLQGHGLVPKLFRVADLERPSIQESAKDFISAVSFNLLISSGTPGLDLLDESGNGLSKEAKEAIFD